MFSGCLSVRLSEVLVREISQEQVVECVVVFMRNHRPHLQMSGLDCGIDPKQIQGGLDSMVAPTCFSCLDG